MVANSRNVEINVQRTLWSESMGHCMNPQCNIRLIGRTSIAEMAHITPHADGGDTSADNLILLCRNCHREIDSMRTEQTAAVLRGWKDNRNAEIRQKFAKRYATFDELQDAITPLLIRNGEIFDDYGPNTQGAENHGLWLKFEPEIIANNSQMSLMLTSNRSLLHPENQNVVDDFNRHFREFVNTRGSYRGIRVNLNPPKGYCSSGQTRDQGSGTGPAVA